MNERVDAPGVGSAPHTAGSPIVSVLIPAWNAEHTIERAVRSVLEERSVPLECVVVDDGSTDGTGTILARLAAADPRVVVVRSPENEGVSEALNRGLDVSRGEWLTFLGADDRILPGGLARLAAAARKSDALVVVGQRVWFDGQRRWVSSFYDIPDIRRPGRKSLADAPGLVYYASGTGKLFHRSVTHGLRFRGRVLGDQPWTIRAMLRAGDRLEVIADTVYEWWRLPPRRDVASITTLTRSSAERGLEAIAVAQTAFGEVAEEARASLPPEAARRVVTKYSERLLRSDLGMHVLYAVRRADPAIGSLFAAIEGFVRAVPAEYLSGSDALARDIVERPLRRWSRLGPEGRAAFWSLLAAALDADPDLARHARDPIGRLALKILGSGPDGPRRVLATLLLRAGSLPARLARAGGRIGRRLRGRPAVAA